MSIVKAFEKAFNEKERKNWVKIYVLVDLHDTIMHGVHQEHELYWWYEWSLIALKMMSMRDDISLILWTGSHKDKIDEFLANMDKRGIAFDYVNENPEVMDDDFYCGKSKLYFNVGIDDRFGFDPETEWETIVEYFSKK